MFNWYRFLDIPLLTNFQLIQEHLQVIIDANLRPANLQWYHHDYQPGAECLVIQHMQNKLEPCKFIHSQLNWSVSMAQSPYAVIHSRLNDLAFNILSPIINNLEATALGGR
jgi:hypothetical protein